RIQALSSAQTALTESHWQAASLRALVHAALEPYLVNGSRIDLDVDDLPIRPDLALTLTLALHELATNAAKYGSLSKPKGGVSLSVHIEQLENVEQAFVLLWEEEGEPTVQEPKVAGFGPTLLGKAMEYQHRGRAELTWRESGLRCRLRLPLSEM